MRNLLVGVLLIAVGTVSARAAEIEDLIKKLQSTSSGTRREAARALSELGKDARPATTALTKALKDSDRFVRRFAAQALGNMGPEAKSAIPALTGLLSDESQPVREAAVRALSVMGKEAVPALAKALRGTSVDVQQLVVQALARAGKEGMEPLIAVIRDVKLDAGLRRRAIEGVVSRTEDGRAAVPALVEVVRVPKARGPQARQLRLEAIEALGRLATAEDRTAGAALEEIVKDEKLRDMGLKNAARQALKKVQGRK